MLENIWEFLRKEILVPECHLFAVCIKMMDFENPNSLEPGLFHAEACILHCKTISIIPEIEISKMGKSVL